MSENRSITVDSRSLFRPETRPDIRSYVGQIWRRRSFIRADAKARAFQEQREYVLGRVWLVLQPTAQAMMYGVLFGLLLQTSRNIENFIGYLFIGITYFGFIVRMTNAGSGLVKSQKNLFVSFNFPRACIVFARALRMSYDAFIPATVAILIALIAQYDKLPSWRLIFLVPLVFLLFVFSTGIMFITARITAFVPDARVVIQILTQAWFYSSCIFYPISRFDHQPQVQNFVQMNPGYRFIEAIRDCVIYETSPSAATWMILMGWSALALIFGLLIFWQAEEKYIEIR